MAYKGKNPFKINRTVQLVGGVEAVTLTGTRTLTRKDSQFLNVDPGGAARNVVLPAEEPNEGLWYALYNAADAAEALTIQDDASATVVVIQRGESATVACDGSAWRVVAHVGGRVTIGDDEPLTFGNDGDATIEYDENGTDQLRFAGAGVIFEQAVEFDGALNIDAAIDHDVALTGTGSGLDTDITINHASQVGVGIDASAVQLTTGRSSGYAAAFRAATTSLAGDSGALYAGLYCLAPTDGGGTAAHVGLYDAGNDYGAYFVDNVKLGLGTGASNVPDMTVGWDGTDLDILPAADDSVIKVGNGTLSCDLWVYGNIATAYLEWDASASQLALRGPSRPRGFNAPSPRFELRWIAGARGKPGVNADIQNAAEATRMVTDPDFEVLGTNASSDDVTYYAEGGITVETDGADNDQVILLPHLDANQSAWTQVTWGTDKETVWECDITTDSSVANTIIWAGLKLTNTHVAATDNDQVYFRYESGVNGGEWQAISSIGGTDDEHDTNVVVATSTRWHLKIVIDAGRTASMYINGALVETSGALTNAVDLIPYIGVQASGAAAAKKIHIHSQAIGRNIG